MFLGAVQLHAASDIRATVAAVCFARKVSRICFEDRLHFAGHKDQRGRQQAAELHRKSGSAVASDAASQMHNPYGNHS